MNAFRDTSRLSLNQYTTFNWTVKEAVDGCARAGLNWIGLWRDKVAAQGLLESAKLVKDAGLKVRACVVAVCSHQLLKANAKNVLTII